MPTGRLLIQMFRRLTKIILCLVVHMLSFEPHCSAPSLSKRAAQHSACFFRLCFASFFGSFTPKIKDTGLKSHQTINQMQGDAGMCSLLGLVADGSNGRRRKLWRRFSGRRRPLRWRGRLQTLVVLVKNVLQAGRAVRPPAILPHFAATISQLRRRVGRPRNHRSKAQTVLFNWLHPVD